MRALRLGAIVADGELGAVDELGAAGVGPL
jgi:hypothetical protein